VDCGAESLRGIIELAEDVLGELDERDAWVREAEHHHHGRPPLSRRDTTITVEERTPLASAVVVGEVGNGGRRDD
jgi:hypothetical protein